MASPSVHDENKQTINHFRTALYDIDIIALPKQFESVFDVACKMHLTTPIDDHIGPQSLFSEVYKPLLTAIPDLERRDYICMAGESGSEQWVGCAGHYVGVFEKAWLDIPPTQQMVAMRYHEFFRLENGKVVEMQAVWDIPQLMMQADAWPMCPSLGAELLAPAPATQDGLITSAWNLQKAASSVKLVKDMLVGLGRSTQGVEAMALDTYWHPKMNWYGPAGIGSVRRISGFRHWHQVPFLNALPDRRCLMDKAAFFGDGEYVAYTGWPGMEMTVSGDGWLGIAPAKQRITMRSLDFWRCENGMIRENWVLIDLIHVYQQLGVDVFQRMRERTFARQPESKRGRV